MKNIKFLFLTLALLPLVRCGKLDLEPIAQESSATAYDSPSKMEAALIGVYNSLNRGTEDRSNEYYNFDVINFMDTRCDNAYAGGDGADIFAIDLITVDPLNRRLEWHWKALYSAIGKANNVIEKAPLVDDPAYKAGRMNQIIGEALFLRAYHYYHLVSMWSGVPLVLNSATSVKPEDLAIARSTSEEVYAQMLKDLDLAITYLPDTYSNNVESKVRATAGAAAALAAKISLQKPNPDPAAALSYIQKVENSTANYKLLNNYDHLFDGQHEYNEESIFEVAFVKAELGTLRSILLLPPSLTPGSGWRKFVTPSHDLINAFNAEGDNIRLNTTVVFETVGWNDEYWGNAANSSIPFVYKWRDGNSGFASQDNNILLRFADIVLLKAEALNRLNRMSEAAVEVNKIRSRVNLPNLTASVIASQDAMKEAILKERRLELAFEGMRWNDLDRNGVLISTMNNLKETDLRTGSFVNYNMTPEKRIVPIPQTEMDLNPKLVQGYL
jgi:starch-binding outer membrane protein, SusD/RagB family